LITTVNTSLFVEQLQFRVRLNQWALDYGKLFGFTLDSLKKIVLDEGVS